MVGAISKGDGLCKVCRKKRGGCHLLTAGDAHVAFCRGCWGSLAWSVTRDIEAAARKGDAGELVKLCDAVVTLRVGT